MVIEAQPPHQDKQSQSVDDPAYQQVFDAFRVLPPSYGEYAEYVKASGEPTARLATVQTAVRTAFASLEQVAHPSSSITAIDKPWLELQVVNESLAQSYQQSLYSAAGNVLIAMFESTIWDQLQCVPGSTEAPSPTKIIQRSYGRLNRYDSLRYDQIFTGDNGLNSTIIQTELRRTRTIRSLTRGMIRKSAASVLSQSGMVASSYTNRASQDGWSLRDMTIHQIQPEPSRGMKPASKPCFVELVQPDSDALYLRKVDEPLIFRMVHHPVRHRLRLDPVTTAQPLLDVLPFIQQLRAAVAPNIGSMAIARSL